MQAKPLIFISCIEEDEDKVKQLYERLSASGFTPWMRSEDVLPGENERLRIKQTIQQADFFLICLSNDALSQRGLSQREIKHALDLWQEKMEDDIYLIPVRLEECELPDNLKDLHPVDLFKEDSWTRLLKALDTGMARYQGSEADATGRKFKKAEAKVKPPSTPTHPEPETESQSVTLWDRIIHTLRDNALITIIAFFTLLVAIGAWLWPGILNPENTPTPAPVVSPIPTAIAPVNFGFKVKDPSQESFAEGIDSGEYASGQELRFHFTPTSGGYTYLFSLDTQGKFTPLWPDYTSRDAAPVEAGVKYETNLFRLDQNEGQEQFFAVTSAEPFSYDEDIKPHLAPQPLPGGKGVDPVLKRLELPEDEFAQKRITFEHVQSLSELNQSNLVTKIINILRDPVFQGISAVIAFIALLLAILTFVRPHPKSPVTGGSPSKRTTPNPTKPSAGGGHSQDNQQTDTEFNSSKIRNKIKNDYDDAELDALCMDHFPEVYDKFSLGMRKDQKINLLLDHCRRFPEDTGKLLSLL